MDLKKIFAQAKAIAAAGGRGQEMSWQEVPQGKGYRGKRKKWIGVGDDAGKKPKYQHADPNQKKARTRKAATPKKPGVSKRPAPTVAPATVSTPAETENRFSGMSPEDIIKEIAAAKPTGKFSTATTVDWGNLRGQGKRSGHMVLGGMRDSSLQGKKYYPELLGKLSEDEKADVGGLDDGGKRPSATLNYLRARAIGLGHDDAVDFAYAMAGDLSPEEAKRRMESRAPATPATPTTPAEPPKPQGKVLYSGVVLDASSRESLLAALKGRIPAGWKPVAHHMTTAFGKELAAGLAGKKGNLKATHVGFDEKLGVLAVRVESDIPSENATPHVTVAVAPHGKPANSNKIADWKPLPAPIALSGTAEDVRAKPEPAKVEKKPEAEVDALAREVKDLYDRAADPSVTTEAIESMAAKLGTLKKDDLVRMSESIGLVGLKARSKGQIAKSIRDRITARKGATLRVRINDRNRERPQGTPSATRREEKPVTKKPEAEKPKIPDRVRRQAETLKQEAARLRSVAEEIRKDPKREGHAANLERLAAERELKAGDMLGESHRVVAQDDGDGEEGPAEEPAQESPLDRLARKAAANRGKRPGDPGYQLATRRGRRVRRDCRRR